LKEGGLGEFEDDTEYAPSGCVSFLTIHQSKGLEFPVVIVGSLEAVPRKQYTDLDIKVDQNYLAKEMFEPIENTKFYDFWRLFYTAFSRAQNLLVLSCSEKSGQGKTPSKYFDEHYKPLISWRDAAFDMTKLSLEPIKDVNIKNEYSFTSHINLYETCAQQYRFFKELEFAPIRTSPMIFGTVVHQTIEDIHKAILAGNEEIVTESKIEEWFQKNYKLISQTERVLLAPYVEKEALNHVLRYFHRENMNWMRVQEAEIEVSLVKPEYILKGSIDLVRGKDGTVEIVDFKSEKKPDIENDNERLERHRRQLEIYAHIYEQRTGQKVSKLHLYFTGEKDGLPYVSFDKSDISINKTISSFDNVVSRIEKNDFMINIRPEKTCTDCDMNNYCNKNWKRKE
ncbi:MAG: PD-(D/E)XK nuclease family protein, partial [Bacteriovoracaceae bacterium]